MGFLQNLATKILPKLPKVSFAQEPLLNPSVPTPKRQTWEDLLKMSRELNAPIPENRYAEFGKPMPTATTTPSQKQSFGSGKEIAYLKPELYDALVNNIPDENIRANIAELSGQESSYGYAGPIINSVEESYGPYHINLKAGRISPVTGKRFTKQEAEDVNIATQHALQEYQKRGGLGAWNPGAYDFYQSGIPTRAKGKTYKKGK